MRLHTSSYTTRIRQSWQRLVMSELELEQRQSLREHWNRVDVERVRLTNFAKRWDMTGRTCPPLQGIDGHEHLAFCLAAAA